ncbi:MAG TPA: molybdopterin-dependent oxidoreductase, partial [Tepidisphaeraceae bacterium]|nr:molybdopterin-dependent oxidoreductase [Tepidisphaeraceae bacterium]
DVLPNVLTEKADVVLPGTFWAEKDGTWENWQSKIQAFAKAVEPPATVRREGDVYLKLLGENETYNAKLIREEMDEPFASVMSAPEPEMVNEPAPEFAEL